MFLRLEEMVIQSPSLISVPLELTRHPSPRHCTPFFSRLSNAGMPRLWQIVTTCTAAEVKLRTASISHITTVSVGTKVFLHRHTISPWLLARKAASPVKYTRAETAERGSTETPEQKKLRRLKSSWSIVSLVSCLR